MKGPVKISLRLAELPLLEAFRLLFQHTRWPSERRNLLPVSILRFPSIWSRVSSRRRHGGRSFSSFPRCRECFFPRRFCEFTSQILRGIWPRRFCEFGLRVEPGRIDQTIAIIRLQREGHGPDRQIEPIRQTLAIPAACLSPEKTSRF